MINFTRRKTDFFEHVESQDKTVDIRKMEGKDLPKPLHEVDKEIWTCLSFTRI